MNFKVIATTISLLNIGMTYASNQQHALKGRDELNPLKNNAKDSIKEKISNNYRESHSFLANDSEKYLKNAQYETHISKQDTKLIQQILIKKGIYSGQANGEMSIAFAESLKELQKKHNLPVTGNLNVKTYQLVKNYSNYLRAGKN